MLARTRLTAGRRGVVLVLILAMLGLLAVIGVTFATFSGQSLVGSRFYVQVALPIDPDRYVDFALGQLINDIDNPMSAIRGHSIKREMYGDDAFDNGLLTQLPNGLPLLVTSVAQNPAGGPADFVITTDIPFDRYAYPGLVGRRFYNSATGQGWTLRLELWDYANGYPVQQHAPPVPQTFQVVGDTNKNGFHQFTLSTSDTQTASGEVSMLVQPNQALESNQLLQFKLVNAYRNAFNGTGMDAYTCLRDPTDPASFRDLGGTFANFRINGLIQSTGKYLGNPATIGMGEDFDAPDLDN